MNNNINKTQSAEDIIELKDILGILINNRWLILAITFFFVLSGFMFTKFRTPIYSTNILMTVNATSGIGDINNVINNVISGGNSNSGASTEMDIIKARSTLEPVVKNMKLNLIAQPIYLPVIGAMMARKYDLGNFTGQPAKPFLGLKSYAWGGDKITLNNLEVSPSWQNKTFILIKSSKDSYTLQAPNGQQIATGKLGENLEIQPNKYTFIKLNIATLEGNPGTRFELSQTRMSNAINNLANRLNITETGKSTNLIRLELTGSDPQNISTLLNTVAETAIQQAINRKSKEASKTLTFLRNQMPDVKLQLDQAEKALNDYRSKTGNIELSKEAQLVMQKLSDMDTRVSELEIKKSQLSQKVTRENPQMKELTGTIIEMKKQRTVLERKIKSLPKADQIAAGLMREVEVQNKVYTNMLGKIQQYELIKAGTIGNLSVIDEANVPYAPINKPASLILALCAFLGLFLSIGFVFIRQYLWHGIEDPDVIEDQFNLPVMASLHESKLQAKQFAEFKKGKIKKMKLLSELDPHDLTVEGLRSLRTNLFFDLPKAKNNVITISGPVPNVGKSFTAANLAQSIADAGKKVLLIDADVRKGDLHHFFNVSRNPGLSELISKQDTVENIVHHTRVPNLDFISTGKFPTRHAEMLMDPNCQTLVDQFSKDYDIVIIDTAPILAVTDAISLCRLAATRIVILGYAKHDSKEINLMLKRFEKAGIKLNGFIFNMVKTSHSYYGNKYKYEYKY